ncbi:hypothetical protein [Polyangium fumosum]|uniref:Uncharacterized protein n=1 Tax=Polyangium fumosum TaxID=889272 RepID=A0A4U1JFQ1_9BACT|nr:hypothetical protein [Polyangium fumosum]TKD10090.1 hypothetical protein E8A74_08700 [Polyangium fumosum]
MEELFRSAFAIVTREPGFIRVRRTTAPMAVVGANVILERLASEFRFRVPLRERKGVGVMLDTREAPMMTDDTAMDIIRPLMMEVLMGFSRNAILVKTAVGKLQAMRRTREEASAGRVQIPVFDDEAQAIAHLRGEDLPTPPPRSSPSKR